MLVVDTGDRDWERAARVTADAIRSGSYDVVYQGVFVDPDGWRGVADFIERQGDGSYEVADTKLARAGEVHLKEIVDRLRETGVREVLVIAGDVKEPAGKYSGAADLLAALDALGDSFDEIGISGYPESHPFIRDETTIQAMFDKAPFASYIVSQLCLDPGTIAWWIGAVRDRGVTLPIHVGIPGVIPRRKLMRISTRIGVGESARFVRRQGNVIARILLRGNVGPGYLLDGLAPEAGRIAGFHVYTFNELGETERWRRATLERASAIL